MAGGFDHLVAGTFDVIVVVASAALHDALAAVAASQRVIARAAQQQVLAVAADQIVIAFAAGQRVVAAIAGNRVIAVAAIQFVAEAVAQDGVVQGVAAAVERAADQLEKLHIGGEGGGDRADDPILRALVGEFGHHVAGLVDEIAVIAGAAAHLVGAAEAVQRVVAARADEHVVGGGSGHNRHLALSTGAKRQHGTVMRRGCRRPCARKNSWNAWSGSPSEG